MDYIWDSIITWLCKDKLDIIYDLIEKKTESDIVRDEKCKELDEARQEFFGDDCYEGIPLSLLIDGLKQDSKNNTDLEYEIEELEQKILDLEGEVEDLEQREKHLIFNSHYGKEKIEELEQKVLDLDFVEYRNEYLQDALDAK